MVMTPVGAAQVGWVVALAVGAAGAPAEALIVITEPVVIQVASFALRTESV